MKYILAFLFLIPLPAIAQQACEIAYIHVHQVLDSLPVPPEIQKRCDFMQDSTSKEIANTKKIYQKKYKDPKIINKKLKQDQATDSANNLKAKRSLMQKNYFKQIRDATLAIYDKGKKYNSVINADSPMFTKLPDKSCDETANCLKIVRELLK